MNVIVFASRKGGSGKSMLTAHVAALASKRASCLLIDADPQASITLWHKLRGCGADPALRSGTRGVADIVKAAKREHEWAFVDTPPNMSAVVVDAIRAATLVIIPARLAVFDLAAIKETIELARSNRVPYAVVINAAPARRDNAEAPFVTESREVISRLDIPVWAGQITNRADYGYALGAGKGVTEFDPRSQAAAEVVALWSAIDRSVKAIHGLYRSAGAMHRVAA